MDSESRPLMARTSLLSRLAGIDVILGELSSQNRDQTEFRVEVRERLGGIEAQQKISNGRLGTHDTAIGLLNDRQEQKSISDDRKRGHGEQLKLLGFGAMFTVVAGYVAHLLGA